MVDHPTFNVAIFALLLSLPWEFGQRSPSYCAEGGRGIAESD
ncbi:hypothetical protein [Sandarakinorhabdus glacialis]|nr:hypothetical protein [Polymorphobacter glacialis]